MTDALDRLRAGDPLAAHPYERTDLSDLVTRITHTPPAAIATWRRFQLRLGAALTGTTLVMVGAIAALQGAGSSLPILNFAAPVTAVSGYSAAQTSPLATTSATTHFTVTNTSNHVRAGALLSHAPSSALAYRLERSNTPGVEASRIARVFGLSGASSRVAPATWRVQGPHATLTYLNTALPTWRFAQAPFPMSTSARSEVSTNLRTLAVALNATLGYHDSLGAPGVTRQTRTSMLAHSTEVLHTTNLTFPVFINGARTSLLTTFTFWSNGALLSASGPAITLSAPYAYPVLSPSEGVRRFNDDQVTAVSSPFGAAARGPFGSTPSRPAFNATLTRATLSLGAFELHNGAAWLLPVYNYVGTSGTQRTSLSLLALDPRFVANATSALELNGQTTP